MKVAVILRRHKEFKISVVTKVLNCKSDRDDVDHFLIDRATDVINDFIKAYPEFNYQTTTWTISIHDVEEV